MSRSVQELLEEIKKYSPWELLAISEALEEEFSLPEPPVMEPPSDRWRFLRYESGYKVVLLGVGSDKIAVMKLLRRDFSLTVKEIKDFLAALPKTIKEPCAYEEAMEVKLRYEQEGAVVSLERGDYLVYDPYNCPPGCAYD